MKTCDKCRRAEFRYDLYAEGEHGYYCTLFLTNVGYQSRYGATASTSWRNAYNCEKVQKDHPDYFKQVTD